ncbi:MAG TPA: hypothetical protein VNT77_01870 [Allosphingosinicella sp.]|nr:hypothetical protein [Allosphingosinicella sp.]
MKKMMMAGGIAALACSGMAAAQPVPGPRGNAAVTRAEAVQKADEQFARLDANRDGRVTREEMQARQQRGGKMTERRAQRGGPEGARGGRMFGEKGFVTQAEFRERAIQRFDRLDSNRDGTVTAAERQQARAQMRERIQQRGN